ncbi:MAG: ATP-binding protein [Candidatus Kuenenia sp.]|nr:ATP-binding protein [Candidatus Kuenenia hertensis]
MNAKDLQDTYEEKITKKNQASPFQKATTTNRRIKLFLWGDSGVGKTTLALQFPSPVVIDLEKGTELYGEHFDFHRMTPETSDQVAEAVTWLLSNDHEYKTLIIDPITIHWEALQKKWSDIYLARNKSSKGYKYEFYDFQPKDWMTLKAEFKSFLRKLIALDMNVIVTAREKTKYKEGQYMQAIGETFDGEKSLPYLFDTIVRLYIKDGKHMGHILKDRSNKLPRTDFECSYVTIKKCFGESLEKQATKTEYITGEERKKIEHYLQVLQLPAEFVASRLADYGAESIDDLTSENAKIIINKLEASLENK